MHDFLVHLNSFMWYMLIITGCIFCISALDDFFFDSVYWLKKLGEFLFPKSNQQPIPYNYLASLPEKKIALIIPCWQEYEVIGSMLCHNLAAIDYRNYDVYVAVYPNDEKTIEAVKKSQKQFNNLYYVINPKPGPSKKADNLNMVFHHIQNLERKDHFKYDIFLMHDAEDIIHPLSLRLYNYIIDQFDMIQTPVIPLEVPIFNFTHWTYNDEFAEIHTKNLVARGLIRGLVPSAGVGTAFSRRAIERLAKEDGKPFSMESFTEDYDSALRIQTLHLKTTFFPYRVARIKLRKELFWFGRLVPHKVNELIATRAFYPMTYSAAVRQRARWVYGIALQEWRDIGWPGSFATRYTLLHDRKAIFTHFVSGFGYIVFLYWLINYFTNGFNGNLKTLFVLLDQDPWVWLLLLICAFFLIERLLNRFIFTTQIYGLIPGLLSPLRVFYGNIISMHTSIRALKNFFIGTSTEKKVKWDKTDHVFPTEEQLSIYNRKLGDVLLEREIITPGELRDMIIEQEINRERLGTLLLRRKYIDLQKLTDIFAQLYNVSIIDAANCKILPADSLPLLPKKDYEWLLNNGMSPISLKGDLLTLAVADPMQLSKRNEIVEHCGDYKTQFLLISLALKLGEILVKHNLVSPHDITEALSDQVTKHEKLGTALIKRGYLTKKQLMSALAEQYNLEIFKDYSIIPLHMLPSLSAESYNWLISHEAFPITILGKTVTVGIADPTDEKLKKEIISNLSPYRTKFALIDIKKQ